MSGSAQVDGVLLRDYTRDDLDAMFEMDQICFVEPFRFTKSVIRRFAEACKAQVLIADAFSGLVGFCIVHRERVHDETVGYLVTLEVDPGCRRLGVARLLLQKAESKAGETGCATMLLHVSSANVDAIVFYEKLDYVLVGKEPAFYGPGLDAFVYQKRLAAELSSVH